TVENAAEMRNALGIKHSSELHRLKGTYRPELLTRLALWANQKSLDELGATHSSQYDRVRLRGRRESFLMCYQHYQQGLLSKSSSDNLFVNAGHQGSLACRDPEFEKKVESFARRGDGLGFTRTRKLSKKEWDPRKGGMGLWTDLDDSGQCKRL